MTTWTQRIIIAVVIVGVCALFAFGVLAGAAVMGYRAAMRSGNEAASMQNLKTIAAVESQYFITHDRKFGTMEQLINETRLSPKFRGNPSLVDGYVFTLTLTPKTDGSPWYKIAADPQDQSSGKNHFYFDPDDDCIRVNPHRQAGPSDQCSE